MKQSTDHLLLLEEIRVCGSFEVFDSDNNHFLEKGAKEG